MEKGDQLVQTERLASHTTAVACDARGQVTVPRGSHLVEKKIALPWSLPPQEGGGLFWLEVCGDTAM